MPRLSSVTKRRRAARRLPLAIAGAVVLASLAATPALASCKNNICVHGHDDYPNRLHTVDLSAQQPGYNVFYVMMPDPNHPSRPTVGPVKLVVPRFQFPIKLGLLYAFAVQACNSNGSCIGWTQFTHRVTADQ